VEIITYFVTALATTAVAKQQHRKLPKSQVVDGPLHRRGRHRKGRHPQRRHHLRLRGPRGASVGSNSISSFGFFAPRLSTYGSKLRGFIFKTLCTTLYYINAMHLVSILVYRDNIYNSIT